MFNKLLSDEQLKKINDYNKNISGNQNSVFNNAFDVKIHFSDIQQDSVPSKITKEEVQCVEKSGKFLNRIKSLKKAIDEDSETNELLWKNNIQFNNDLNEINIMISQDQLIAPLLSNLNRNEYSRVAYFLHELFVKPIIEKFEKNYFITVGNTKFLITKQFASTWVPCIQRLNENGIITQCPLRWPISAKESLLRLILSNSSPFKIPLYANNPTSMPIFYGSIIEAIHSNIIDYLTNEVQIYATANGNPAETAKALFLTRLKLAHLIYEQSSYDYDFAKQIQFRLISKYNDSLNDISVQNRYIRSLSLLRILCSNSIFLLNKISVLIAKIYVGRKFMKHLALEENNATIIISRNPQFVQQFLLTVIKGLQCVASMTYYMRLAPLDYSTSTYTEYTINDLSSPQIVIELLYHKLNGHIINIDSSKQNTISPQLKEIISGNIKLDDEVVEKIYYSSNAHFVFLRNTDDNKLLKEMDGFSDVIDLSDSPTDEYLYDNTFHLDEYEIYFLVVSLIRNGIELMLEKKESVTVSTQELDLRNFADKYLKYITAEASTDDDSDKQKRASIPFVHADILYSHYLAYQTLMGKRSYSSQDFRSKIKGMFPDASYQKKHTSFKDAMAFIGLQFNELQFESDMKELQNHPSVKADTSKEFSSFVEKLINDYHEYVSSQMKSISADNRQ